MNIHALGLSADQKAFRKRLIGGSDANIIMGGDASRILRLWREKRGEIEPENLDGVLPVRMGQWTEELNRIWYAERTGRPIDRVGEELLSLDFPAMGCTLDGMTTTSHDQPAVFEAKHVSAYAKPDEVRAKYLPQATHNMLVAGVSWCVLSVFLGTLKWEVFEIPLDHDYADELVRAETLFWNAVTTGEPPVAVEVAPPAPPAVRVVDMQGNNAWAMAAGDYLETIDHAKRHDEAAKTLRGLMDDDVSEASGHGIKAKRAKDRSIRFSLLKD